MQNPVLMVQMHCQAARRTTLNHLFVRWGCADGDAQRMLQLLTGSLNEDVVKLVPLEHQPFQCSNEVTFDRTAEAAICQLHPLLSRHYNIILNVGPRNDSTLPGQQPHSVTLSVMALQYNLMRMSRHCSKLQC